MKKYIFSLAIASAAFAACTEFDEETSKVYPDGPTVEVSIEATGDSAVSYTVTPAEGATRFAYALIEGDASNLTADDVVEAMVNGKDTVKLTSESKSVTNEVKDLTPNTTYSIVAVAYNQYGNTGAVVSKSAKTSDGLDPEVESFKAIDSALVVTFSEPVVIADTAAITALKFVQNGENVEDAEISDVSVNGNKISFYIEGAKPGLYVSVGWPTGAITDKAKNPVDGIEAGFGEGYIWDRIAAGTFTIGVESMSCEGVFASYADIDKFSLTFTTDQPIFAGSDEDAALLTATYSVKSSTISAEISTKIKIVDENTVTVSLPAEVMAGQSFALTLDSAALQDVDGNYSKALTLIAADTMLTLSATTPLSEIVGTYDASYDLYSEKASVEHAEEWTIADGGESDGYEYLVSLSGVGADVVETPATALGIYNSLTHTLSIDETIGKANYKGDEVDVYLLDNESDGEEMATIGFLSNGKAAATSYWMVYYDGLGTADYIMNAKLVRK